MTNTLTVDGHTFECHGVSGRVGCWNMAANAPCDSPTDPNPSDEVKPACGSEFLVLDDHTAVDNQGVRTASTTLANAPPIDTRSIIFDDDEDNRTYGEDGACADLEVVIADGEQLCFRWKFISDDQGLFNDFALVVAYPDSETPPPPQPHNPDQSPQPPSLLEGAVTLEPTPRIIMGSNWPANLEPLAQKRSGVTNTNGSPNWQQPDFCWRPQGGFSGTVRWIVSNGMRLPRNRHDPTKFNEPTPQSLPSRLAFPPTLLIDCVHRKHLSLSTSRTITMHRFRLFAAASLLTLAGCQIGDYHHSKQPPRTIRADVVALDQPLTYNRFGSFNPYGMIYALVNDVDIEDIGFDDEKLRIGRKRGGDNADVRSACPGLAKLKEDVRPRPLVLRGNEGDRLQVRFTNYLLPNRRSDWGPGGQPNMSRCNWHDVDPANPVGNDGPYPNDDYDLDHGITPSGPGSRSPRKKLRITPASQMRPRLMTSSQSRTPPTGRARAPLPSWSAA